MRHAQIAVLLVSASLMFSACTQQTVPDNATAFGRPELVLTVPVTPDRTDASLHSEYGGELLLRTSTFALIGVKQGGLQAQSKGRVKAEENRRAIQLTASGTVGLWASGTVGLWASGASTAEKNLLAWEQIRLNQAHQLLPALGEGVTVAVIDTGLDLTHPAFAGRLAPQDTWHDFVDEDSVPQEQGAIGQGFNGHGTEVAGIVLEVAPKATILPLRILNGDGQGDLDKATRSIVWATDHGADIINLSLGTSVPLNAISAAIAYANSKGVAVIAAAGNAGTEGLDFPAREFASQPLNLSVGSVSSSDVRSAFSQYGAALGISAPGEGIFGPAPLGGMAAWTGTSMSTPAVSGAVALGLSSHKASGVSRIVAALKSTASRLDSISGNEQYATKLGAGRIDLEGFARQVNAF